MRCFTEHVAQIKVYFIYRLLNLNLLFEPFFCCRENVHLNVNHVRVPYGKVELKLQRAVLLNILFQCQLKTL